MTRMLIILLMISLSCLACDQNREVRDSAPDPDETSEDADFTEFDHLRGQRFTGFGESIDSTCFVRGDRRYSACSECLIACLQDQDTLPSGLYLGNSPALIDAPRLVAYGDSLMVNDVEALELNDGEVDAAHMRSGLHIEPLYRELQDVVEARKAEARRLGETFDPTLYVLLNPDYPWRLGLQILYTATEVGLEGALLYERDEDITELRLECQINDDESLYETADNENRPLGADLLERRSVQYLCMPGEPTSNSVEQSAVDFWIPRSVQRPTLPGGLTDRDALSVEIDDERIQLREPSGPDSILSLTGGDEDPDAECVDDDVTICVSDDGLYDFEQLSAAAARWRSDRPESIAIIAADEELAIGVVQQAIGAVLYRDNEPIFEDFAVAVL